MTTLLFAIQKVIKVVISSLNLGHQIVLGYYHIYKFRFLGVILKYLEN